MEHLPCAVFKELRFVWKRRHVYEARQSGRCPTEADVKMKKAD